MTTSPININPGTDPNLIIPPNTISDNEKNSNKFDKVLEEYDADQTNVLADNMTKPTGIGYEL